MVNYGELFKQMEDTIMPEIKRQMEEESVFWRAFMDNCYPYPFEVPDSVGRTQKWAALSVEGLLNIQRIVLRDIGRLTVSEAQARNLHGVTRELLRRQLDALNGNEVQFVNGKGLF